MKKNRIRLALGAGLLAVGVSLLAYYTLTRPTHPAWSPSTILNNVMESDHQDGTVYKIMDRDNQLLSKMSRQVVAGDELITSNGRRYKIREVKDNNAWAEFTGLDRELLAYQDQFEHLAVPAAGQTDWKNRPIAIYHTHSAESYVPTDGTESKPYDGGIFEVGDALTAELEKRGVKVIHSKTPHEPRDSNAYYRSRRTASELMKSNPVAIIDVHRDGIPDPAYYNKNIAGEGVTQIRLVVGRQNPKMQSNMEFAKKMMAYTNKVHPGIVKEIFIARGNYNQDLMSTAALIEVGTHTNSRIAAQKGAALFADALPGMLDVGGAAGAPSTGTGNYGTDANSPGGWKTLAWIIGIALLGGGAFLLVSSGSLKNAKSRLSGYWGKEFAGFIGPVKKRINTPKGDVETDYSESANNAALENREKFKKD